MLIHTYEVANCIQQSDYTKLSSLEKAKQEIRRDLEEFYKNNSHRRNELLDVVNTLDKTRVSMLCQSGLATQADIDEVAEKNTIFFEKNS